VAEGSRCGRSIRIDLGEFGSATLLKGQEGTFAVTSNTPISLLAGTRYWLVLSRGDDFTEVLWEQNAFFAVPWADSTDAIDPNAWMTTDLEANAQFAVDGTPTAVTPPRSPLRNPRARGSCSAPLDSLA
jgi:hypothetical protein